MAVVALGTYAASALLCAAAMRPSICRSSWPRAPSWPETMARSYSPSPARSCPWGRVCACRRWGFGGAVASRTLLSLGGKAPEFLLCPSCAALPPRLGSALSLIVRCGVSAGPGDDARLAPGPRRLERRAAGRERVEQFTVVAHEDADSGKRREQLGELRARLEIEAVGGLVDGQHVGALPQRAGDLQLLALTEAQLVPAPGHVVGEIQPPAELARLAAEVEREVRQGIWLLVGLLRAVGAEEASSFRWNRVKLQDEAAGDFGVGGFAAAVVAQKAGKLNPPQRRW